MLALFNASNQIINQSKYLPFGEAQSATQTIPNRIRYAGRELEDESGLYYNNARWYDPTLHRFVSQDPDRDRRRDQLVRVHGERPGEPC